MGNLNFLFPLRASGRRDATSTQPVSFRCINTELLCPLRGASTIISPDAKTSPFLTTLGCETKASRNPFDQSPILPWFSRQQGFTYGKASSQPGVSSAASAPIRTYTISLKFSPLLVNMIPMKSGRSSGDCARMTQSFPLCVPETTRYMMLSFLIIDIFPPFSGCVSFQYFNSTFWHDDVPVLERNIISLSGVIRNIWF